MPKQKRVVKSKEQIMDEQKRMSEATRLRNILKTTIYPELLKLKSVEEVQYFIGGLMDVVKKISLAMGNELKLKDLEFKGKTLIENIAADNEDFPHYKVVVEALMDESVNNASAVLEGFGYAIQACMRKENKERKIADFKDLETHFNQ